ncbi:MAG: hypothetical protein RR458_02310 [Clostridia bacterium]
MSTVLNLILVVIWALFFIGFCILQVNLSKKENKWLGLIIPIASFAIISLFLVMNYGYNVKADPALIWQLFAIIALCNIPTYIFLGIYFVVRKIMKKKKDVEKINILDL